MRYEVILEKGNYALIDRGEKLKELAVVYGLDKKNGEWKHTCSYFAYEYKGSTYNMPDKAEAFTAALECFREKTEENYISCIRLEELATCFKNALLEDDKYSALVFFDNFCEMTESEKKWFGIDEEE